MNTFGDGVCSLVAEEPVVFPAPGAQVIYGSGFDKSTASNAPDCPDWDNNKQLTVTGSGDGPTEVRPLPFSSSARPRGHVADLARRLSRAGSTVRRRSRRLDGSIQLCILGVGLGGGRCDGRQVGPGRRRQIDLVRRRGLGGRYERRRCGRCRREHELGSSECSSDGRRSCRSRRRRRRRQRSPCDRLERRRLGLVLLVGRRLGRLVLFVDRQGVHAVRWRRSRARHRRWRRRLPRAPQPVFGAVIVEPSKASRSQPARLEQRQLGLVVRRSATEGRAAEPAREEKVPRRGEGLVEFGRLSGA